jgi:hypothetical protein
MEKRRVVGKTGNEKQSIPFLLWMQPWRAGIIEMKPV